MAPLNDYSLRPAQAQDIWAIRRLVVLAMLDPTQLRWDQFWVAEQDGKILGCGQLRHYGAAQELGSLVVAAAWRGQGIGTALAQQLIQQAQGPLYLECLGEKRANYYRQLGFTEANWSAMPPEIARKFRFSCWVARALPVSLWVMEYRA